MRLAPRAPRRHERHVAADCARSGARGRRRGALCARARARARGREGAGKGRGEAGRCGRARASLSLSLSARSRGACVVGGRLRVVSVAPFIGRTRAIIFIRLVIVGRRVRARGARAAPQGAAAGRAAGQRA